MDKVETWVNIGASIISSVFLFLNYRIKVASKKSEKKAEESKKETKEIVENAKKELIKISQEKNWIQEYSSIETELKSMRSKLDDLRKEDDDILLYGITPKKNIDEVRKSLLNVRERTHLPGLANFNFQMFDEKLTEIERADQDKRIDNVKYLQMVISTQISFIREQTDSIK
ncbi:(4Fe-4S)-binding protein [Enterococcus faecium]|nr:(4Fe-4S)-binding protein [Enterococcus faecium]EGP5172050.1 (4Fe-4S)-binding protein [Enterococcus faecium]EME7116475.1 (4Fe-4S)-binding protein [Enterococcus faecium]EMF0582380.1 (4Fe-4S)-binding protein [Enterococcus faecium]